MNFHFFTQFWPFPQFFSTFSLKKFTIFKNDLVTLTLGCTSTWISFVPEAYGTLEPSSPHWQQSASVSSRQAAANHLHLLSIPEKKKFFT